MPGAPVPSRSVQNGASTLFGRAGFGQLLRHELDVVPDVPPPTTE